MAIDPKRVKEIFLVASELSDGALRSAYLDRACGVDAELRRRVEALLRSHDPDGSFLGAPAAVVPDPDHAGTMAYDSPALGDGPTPADGDQPLGFLTPSTRPDSQGRIGHYEVLQVLGRGGFGIVFRAFDEMLQRVVAIKVMAPEMAATSPARKRFLREARSSAQVRHESVVQVYEVAETPLPYLVMEFIPGETLQQKLDRKGPLDVLVVVRIGRQIAEGLAAAHATDLIHRDIKPANILIEGGTQRKVKITDFGLARAADDASMTQSGMIAGTPMYMAPEQALGKKLDQRADLFSLGSVLYQMAAGRPPFRANSTLAVLKRVAEDTPRPIREVIPETPHWLCDIITTLHAKNPDDRYQSAREVADVLAGCEQQLKAHGKVTGSLRDPGDEPTPTTAGGRRRRIWVAAAAVLAPLIAVGVFALTRPTQPIQTADNGKAESSTPVVVGKEPVTKNTPPQATDPDRLAALHVLSIGGTLRVNDQTWDIKAATDLPRDAFRLTGVDLQVNNQAGDETLARLKDCKNLTRLHLYDTKVGDAGLAHLKGFKNLTYLQLAGTQVTDAGLAHFANCKNLKALYLNNTQVGDAGVAHFKDCKSLLVLELALTQVTDTGLAYFQGNKHLTDLYLSSPQMTDAGLAHFKDCQHLTYLNLSQAPVGDAGLAHFKDCKNLTKLFLHKTRVTAAKVEELRKALPRCAIYWEADTEPMTTPDPDRRAAVHVLKLGGAVQVNEQPEFINAVANLPRDGFRLKTVHLLFKTQVTDADLAQLQGCKHLVELRLSGCTQVGDAGVAHFKDCKKLLGLGLDGTKVSDKGLSHFKDVKELKLLQLSDTQIGDDGLTHFMACKGLVDLDLSGTQISDEGLASFKDCVGLGRLGLARTKVSDAGLAHLKKCNQLTTLFVTDAPIGDEGLAHLKDCAGLMSLHLKGTKVTGAGLAQLKSRSKLELVDLDGTKLNDPDLAIFKDSSSLTTLILSNTKVGDAGLVHLMNMKTLKTLKLNKTRVTPRGIEELKKVLPNCTIEQETAAAPPGTGGEIAAKQQQLEWAEKR